MTWREIQATHSKKAGARFDFGEHQPKGGVESLEMTLLELKGGAFDGTAEGFTDSDSTNWRLRGSYSTLPSVSHFA